ncbi:MAG: hypothetical protein R3B96_19395 [Pirellulaceae bacterium]
MKSLLSALPFIALTALCWGVYGPVLHKGQYLMGENGIPSSLRPLICVGIAYFIIAVIFPLAVLFSKGEKGSWTTTGFIWSFLAARRSGRSPGNRTGLQVQGVARLRDASRVWLCASRQHVCHDGHESHD